MPRTQPSLNDVSLCSFLVCRHVAVGLCGILLSAVYAHGHSLTISNPTDLLATDPAAFSASSKSRGRRRFEPGQGNCSQVASAGEITGLRVSAREKLAGLRDPLRAAQRDGVYEIKVVNLPQAGIGISSQTARQFGSFRFLFGSRRKLGNG